MGLLYNATKWLDHVTQHPMRRKITQNADGTSDVVRAEGDIIQQGTPRNAKNYNNMEEGILANQIHLLVLGQHVLQLQRSSEENHGEFGTIRLENLNDYPFSSASVTIPLNTKRTTIDYVVNVEIVEADGNVDEIIVSGKQLNGFKMAFKGSAKDIQVKYKVEGGIQ